MTSLREEILEDCVKAEAHKPSQIISIAISVFEKKIDDKRREYSEPYEKNSYWHGYKDALIELLEELQKEKEFLK